MKLNSAFLILLATTIGLAAPISQASAQALLSRQLVSQTSPRSPQDALVQLFTQKPQSQWFHPSLLKKISLEDINANLSQAKEQFGAYKSIKSLGGDQYRLLFERVEFTVKIQYANGQIVDLAFEDPKQLEE